MERVVSRTETETGSVSKWEGVEMSEEDKADYEKVWSDMEDNFNNLEMIPEEEDETERQSKRTD